MSRHDSTRRAEASADPRVRRRQRLELANAAPGKNTWGEWTPVKGPHLKTLRMRQSRNRTGVPGISYTDFKPRTGPRVRAFIVNLGKTNRRFRIDTLGKDEAWRRAVRLRAEHENSINQINAAIKQARQKNQTSHV